MDDVSIAPPGASRCGGTCPGPPTPPGSNQSPEPCSSTRDCHRSRRLDRVEIREIRILPGHAAGLHVHNGPVVGGILAGSAVYQIEGQPAILLRAGDVFFEPEGERIARFDAQDDGVTFLAYFLLSPGQEPQLAWPGQPG